MCGAKYGAAIEKRECEFLTTRTCVRDCCRALEHVHEYPSADGREVDCACL